MLSEIQDIQFIRLNNFQKARACFIQEMQRLQCLQNYECYDHIIKNFKPKRRADIAVIALKLGLKSFIDHEQVLELASSEYNQFQFWKIPAMCTQIYLKGISFYQNQQPQMMKQLSQCRYTNLLLLNLSGNRLDSIESISKLDANKLKTLNLETNNITILSGLQKLRAPSLQFLMINQNKWTEIYRNDCNFGFPVLSRVQVRSAESAKQLLRTQISTRYIKLLTVSASLVII